MCFTVYGNETIQEEAWTPFMQSIVVFGRYRMIDSGSKAMELLKKLALKYYLRREAGGWGRETAHGGNAA